MKIKKFLENYVRTFLFLSIFLLCILGMAIPFVEGMIYFAQNKILVGIGLFFVGFGMIAFAILIMEDIS